MTLPWTAEQCEWLRAMGHAVFVHGTPPPAADSRTVQPVVPRVQPAAHAVPATATRSGQAPVERARPTAPLAPAVDQQPPATPVAAPSAGLRTLHRALLRAAGQRTARAAEAVLAELGVDTAAVRGDAAAKRALWARLRARRGQGSR